MKKILVTGANGFIGRRILPLLEAKGYEIYAVQRSPGISTDKRHITLCNLSDESQVETLLREIRPTYLLHLAWYTEHGKFWDSLENIDWIRKSLFLVRKFSEFSGKRAVIAGSCAEYSWDSEVLNETTNTFQPVSLYGKSKNFLRILLEEFAKEKDLSLAWARVFFLYGHDEPKGKIVASMIDQFRKNETFNLKNGHIYRDFLHVDDVADAFAHIVDSSIDGQINVASGEATSLHSIGKLLHSMIGKGNLIVSEESESLSSVPKVITGDTKMLNQLQWSPKFTLDSGLSEVVHASAKII